MPRASGASTGVPLHDRDGPRPGQGSSPARSSRPIRLRGRSRRTRTRGRGAQTRRAGCGRSPRSPWTPGRVSPGGAFSATAYAERMPLKVVPAGDERCDIHKKRSPAQYICESCMRELGVETTQQRTSRRPLRRRVSRRLRRWRSEADWRVTGAVAVAVLVLAAVLTGITSGGGGGGAKGPSEADVVEALGLVRAPSGTWLTADGNCEIV